MCMSGLLVTYTHAHLLGWHYADSQIGPIILLEHRCQVMMDLDGQPAEHHK